MDTLEQLTRKMAGAQDIKSVVRTMKAMAAANIGQYELAVGALGEYHRTVALGLVAYFASEPRRPRAPEPTPPKAAPPRICALVFGSDQGLVGSFNGALADFVGQALHALSGPQEVWAVGERVQLLLADRGLPVTSRFGVPGSIKAVTPLVGKILLQAQQSLAKGALTEFYIFHNQPTEAAGYQPVQQRLLPLDAAWRAEIAKFAWPTNTVPQVAGGRPPTLAALLHELLFVSLFKACAESLASENASRLQAMQRAEKNINSLLDDLSHQYYRERQSAIDEELFDVVAGFEALKKEKGR
ncbi:F0F1 ATP synthase subunit gamma [Hymenobacter sp. UV11]|uniref:F0F1 ATP synthase subunit gamma n=1 Tax=Hymenobacter sp. UV11 TaxID=1849735 RepID=UPI00105BB5EF|nr:F0F1 ATP synthase subunit gamma [Hymenobacter sp. UV11]TDN38815.1 F0F1 ATP synthase subunit gamma [Hymenobacter sp. UV11]TFZ63806.1 F0F1 ATP synthase subunit gamma [Hymenobacter sp. UV11]